MIFKTLDKPVLGPNGESVQMTEKDTTPLLVRAAIAAALLTDIADTEKKPGNSDTKVERYDVFVRIKSLKENEFSKDDVSHMRAAVLACYTTLVAGQIVDVLEGKDRPVVKSGSSK